MSSAGGWRAHLVEDREGITAILDDARRVAVLGIKTERQGGQPAFYVPEYLKSVGYQVVPVPTYYPDVETILGEPVHRAVAGVPGRVDLVVVFRRPEHLSAHVDDLIAAKPGAVWFQSGIRNDDVAEKLAQAGIDVVQDRCVMVEHRARVRRGSR